jgi:hypothetical protein
MSSPLWHKGFPDLTGTQKTLTELLTSGELPEDQYLAWATEEYKIPSVAAEFFANATNFNLLLDNPSAEWEETFFPICEWDGILYIACLEPREFNYKKKYCLVLSPYTEMQGLWKKLEQPLESTVIIDNLEFSEATLLSTTANAPSENSNKPETSKPKTKTTTVATSASVEPTPAAPSLLDLNFSNLITASEPESTAPKTAPPMTPQPATPAATAASPKPDAKPKVQPPPPHPNMDDSFSRSDINISPKFTSTNYTLPKEFTDELAKERAKTKAAVKEVTNVAHIPRASKNEATFTATKTIMPFPERTSQFTFTRTIYSNQVILEAEAKIENNQDPQHALLSAFKLLQDYYKKLMWVVRDQKGYAYPIACNAEWEFTEEAWNQPMAFKHVNPFRTAKLTQKPYHGPVYSSPATDKYFRLWNQGKKPDFFTVVPITMYGKVFGYLVGCDKGPHFDKINSLEVMEMAGKELLETFINIHKIQSKAA